MIRTRSTGWLALVLLLLAVHVPDHARSQPAPDYKTVAGLSGTAIGGSAAAWGKFLGEQPQWAAPLNHAVAAIQINQKLETGDIDGAVFVFGGYAGGLFLSAMENAGHGPWGTGVAVFNGWVAANELVRDLVFLPTLVDGLYAPYEALRQQGLSPDDAWNEIGTYGLNAVLAEVKRQVVRPELGLDPDAPDLGAAQRTETARAAGKTIRVTWVPEDRWPYGRPILIRHAPTAAGRPPAFASVIDISLTGRPDGQLADLMYEITRLNERYSDAPNYLSSTGLAEVEVALGGLLAKLSSGESDADLGRRIEDLAQAYVHARLEARFTQARLVEGIRQAATRGNATVGDAVAAFHDWLDRQTPIEEPDGVPFIDLDCCRWWEVNEGGRRVKGWYVNADGDKVAYTSRPLDALTPAYAGLSAGASGSGYHVYRTGEPDQNLRVHMIVVRLGITPETIFDDWVNRWTNRLVPGGYASDWEVIDPRSKAVIRSGTVVMN
jgi:hypothetical protein